MRHFGQQDNSLDGAIRLTGRFFGTARILIALIIGLALGGLSSRMEGNLSAAASTLLLPVGKLWLDALTMTVVPLVFGLVVTGIMSASATGEASAVASRALFWFAFFLVGACLLSAVVATSLLVWWPMHPLPHVAVAPVGVTASTGAQWFDGLIPTNPIKAAAESAIVPIVIFALFFGFAATRIERRLQEALRSFFDAVVQTMLVIVGWILFIAPIGILALAFGAGKRMGASAIGVLGQYIVIVAVTCLVTTAVAYGAVAIFGKVSVSRFARAASPAQAVAFGTQSSLACLPVMVEAGPALGVSPASAGLVLPLAVSIFRAASAAANVAVAIYLAHLYAVPLPVPILVMGALIAAPVSLAAVGLPAQVSFFATIGPVCIAMGVPVEMLPLLLAVETLPDLFRTIGNVTFDLAVTCIAGEKADISSYERLDAAP